MKRALSVLLTIAPLTTIAATIPDGKTEKPFVIDGEVICLKRNSEANHPLSQFI
jgi:hypothetical protein